MTDTIPSGLGLETTEADRALVLDRCTEAYDDQKTELDCEWMCGLLRDFDRLITALSEAQRLSASQYAALQAKCIRDGIAREAAAREEEREACAKIAEGDDTVFASRRIAAAIRARSQS